MKTFFCLTTSFLVGIFSPLIAYSQDLQAQQSIVQAPSDFMTRIRKFLGVQPRTVSVGGTRSSSAKTICMLAPGPIVNHLKSDEVVGYSLSPVLVFGTSLNEIQILSEGSVVWSRLASSKSLIKGSIKWPINPLKPSQVVTLMLRPSGGAGGDWATVRLRIAPLEEIKNMATVTSSIESDDTKRISQIEDFISAGSAAKAVSLIWDGQQKPDSQIGKLRALLLNECD